LQLAEWEVYNRINPIGTKRIDYLFAAMCSVITNNIKAGVAAFGGKKSKKPKMTRPEDFLPMWDAGNKEQREPKKQSVEQMKRILMGIASSQNRKKK